jgi:lysozyme
MEEAIDKATELKKYEIRWSAYKAIGVALATTTVVGLTTAFINMQLQNREITIKEFEQEQSYLSGFTEFAIHDIYQTRISFAEYVSFAASSQTMRDRWKGYKNQLVENEKRISNRLEKAKENKASDPERSEREIRRLEELIFSSSNTSSLPNKAMKTSESGLDLIQQFEGYYSEAYKDTNGQWTIGIGHIGDAAIAGKEISADEAQRLLSEDLNRVEKAIADKTTVALTQNQFNALSSFVFNVGVGNFSRSTLLKKINSNDLDAVPSEFQRWTKQGGKPMARLVKRRAAEGSLWLKN